MSLPTTRTAHPVSIASRAAVAIAALTLLGASADNNAAAQPPSIGVNFIGGFGGHFPTDDASSLVPADVAGFVPQGNWNNVAPWSVLMSNGGDPNRAEVGSATNLLDSAGLPTGVNVTWSGSNTWAATNPSIDNANERLLDGYLDNSAAIPLVDIVLTGIPYTAYDVVVYFGSDGNGRDGSIQLNEDPSTQRFFITATGGGAFNGEPGSFVETTAVTPSSAPESNYVYYETVVGGTLRIQNIRGSSNSGIHGFQIVPGIAPLSLDIDMATGNARIVGIDDPAVDVDGIDIVSDLGALRVDRFSSLGGQGLDVVDGPADADSTPGNSPGERWEVVDGSPNRLIEGFLFGHTTFGAGDSVSLGRLYDTTLGEDPTLRFSYSTTDGRVRFGSVRYLTGLPGDFNADGVVDAADYTVYRDGLGVAYEPSDLAVWRANYGRSATSTTQSVPEPTAWCAGLMLAAVGATAPRRHGA